MLGRPANKIVDADVRHGFQMARRRPSGSFGEVASTPWIPPAVALLTDLAPVFDRRLEQYDGVPPARLYHLRKQPGFVGWYVGPCRFRRAVVAAVKIGAHEPSANS